MNNKKNMLFVLFLLFSTQIYSQDIRLASMSFEIKKNTKTKLEILNTDSISLYTVFENLIDRNMTIFLMRQPIVFELLQYIKEAIYIPIPILDTDTYFIKYSTNDTSYTRKFFY